MNISQAKRSTFTLITLFVIVATILAALLSSTINAKAQTQAQFRVDANGNITKNGAIFRVKGGSWFGLQGRYEPASDSANPRGAPMEQYMGNVFWAPSSRTYDSDIAEMVALGINVIRIPVSHQTFDASDPQGSTNLKNNPSVVIANSRLALETIAKKIDAAGISIMWDIHSCSNYVDWRKGRLDARPPFVDATRDNYDFRREDSSCAASGNPASVTRIQAYNTSLWLADLQLLANFSNTLGLVNVIGIDIFNEPWDYSWAEWKSLSEQAYTTINAANPNLLIFMQGISASYGNQDGSPTTVGQSAHGSSGIDPNWGENLFDAGANPPAIPQNRLVFTPHAYGPSVFVGKQFMDPAQPACTGLEGDAAGDADCNIVINPTLLRQGWDEHFGYLKAMGYAVVIGEWGGNMDWPHGAASQRDIDRFGYLPNNNTDRLWQEAFRDYLISKCILDTVYWSINPESGDTGGLYSTPYTEQNKTAWGTWGSWDTRKTSLVQSLWNSTATCGGGTPVPTLTPTRTSPPGVTLTPTRTLTSPPGITNTPTATIVNACTGTGSISRDYWTGVSGTAVSAIPTGNTPSGSDTLASLRAVNWSNSSQNKDWADSYGERLRGYVCAPTSGNYTFWIASDDSSELWLSTDSNSANKQLVASQTDWTNQDEWTKQSSQKSAVIALTSGTSYYIEVLHKEGGGGDNLSVGWAKPGDSTSAPSEIVPGNALKPYVAGPTNTPGPSLTPTRTLTPPPVMTNTPTRTLTSPPVMTNTPTRTNTRTNTPNVTNTRTRTPTTGPSATRTRTPTTGPSATRTATPPPGITNTPTRTNTPPPAMTNTPTTPPVITNTPTQPTGGACTPTSTVTAPFTYDGAGTFCWQIATIPGYVNSWNTTSVSINGTNYTNVWVGAGSLPAKINGNYYVAYNSSVAWGHIEIR